MRTTSAAAYEAIKSSGLITKRERQIVDALYFEGDLTGEELDHRIKNPSIHKRLAGLQAKGVIFNPGTKTSPITGRKGFLWGLCDSPCPPTLPGIPLTTRQEPRKALVQRIIVLEAELAAYQAEFGHLSGGEALKQPAPVYFFSHSGSTLPSPYFDSIAALKNSIGYKFLNGHCNIWTGTHEAPIPVEMEK